MENIKLYFNHFDYKEKSFILKVVDFCNQGVYGLLQSKRIKIYRDVKGDKKYSEYQLSVNKLATIVTLIALPLLLFTITYKLKCNEQSKIEASYKRLVHQTKVMQKIHRTIAAVKIQRAFRVYNERRETAAIKIQRAFRDYLTRKRKKENEQKWYNRVGNFVYPYLPNIKEQALNLAEVGIKATQQMAVNLICDTLTIQACAVLGVDPSDVKMGVQIEKTLDQYGF